MREHFHPPYFLITPPFPYIPTHSLLPAFNTREIVRIARSFLSFAKIVDKETSAPKGAWQCNFPAFLEIITDRTSNWYTKHMRGLVGKLNKCQWLERGWLYHNLWLQKQKLQEHQHQHQHYHKHRVTRGEQRILTVCLLVQSVFFSLLWKPIEILQLLLQHQNRDSATAAAALTSL